METRDAETIEKSKEEEKRYSEELIIFTLYKNKAKYLKWYPKLKPVHFTFAGHRELFEEICAIRKLTTDNIIDVEKAAVYSARLEKNRVNRMMLGFILQRERDEAGSEIFEKFIAYSIKKEYAGILSRYLTKVKQQGVAVESLMGIAKELNDFSKRAGDYALNSASVVEAKDAIEMAKLQVKDFISEKPLGTGIPEIDRKLFLERIPNGLTYIGGRSGLGKTTFMCYLARHFAQNGIGSLIFSLEMSAEQLMFKLAQSDVELSGRTLTNQTIKSASYINTLYKALDKLKELPIYIIDGVFNIEEVESIVRFYSNTKGVTTTFIDYVQLMSLDSKGNSNKQFSDTTEVSKRLKRLTKPDREAGYPANKIIALSQYTEEKGTPATAKPKNEDLRYSKQLFQDADLILHLYLTREIYEEGFKQVSVYCGKQREGIAEWVEPNITFDLARQTFFTPSSRSLTGETDLKSASKSAKVGRKLSF